MSTRQFVEECLKKEIFSPSEMSRRWNRKYGLEGKEKAKTSEAFTKAMRRMGISAEKRLELKHEARRQTKVKDIEEYEEVEEYVAFSKGVSGIQKRQIKRTLTDLRQLWEWMNYTNPQTWKLSSLIECLEKHIPRDHNGKWSKSKKVLKLLGAFNRTFQGHLPKGWSMGLKREAGELKDFMQFKEFEDFINNLDDAYGFPQIMWISLYTEQVNAGCREGATKERTGILSLKWEDIDYNTKRCQIRDKGKKGKAERIWIQVPLDLFPFLDGWETLMKWHEERYGYRPTQEKHESGRCFPVTYVQYRRTFHKTRHRCRSRISQDIETMRPHIFRQTHAQWCARLKIPLQWICGQFPYGWYGVGWDDPKILLKYYLTLETDEMYEINKKMLMRMEKLDLNAPLIMAKT